MKVSIRVSFGDADEAHRTFQEVVEEAAETGCDAIELVLHPGDPWGASWAAALEVISKVLSG